MVCMTENAYPEPLIGAATALLTKAPSLSRARLAWGEGDDVNWPMLEDEWEAKSGAWSGSERRLMETVAHLSKCDPYGLDEPNAQALVDALRLALDLAEAQLALAAEGRQQLHRP